MPEDGSDDPLRRLDEAAGAPPGTMQARLEQAAMRRAAVRGRTAAWREAAEPVPIFEPSAPADAALREADPARSEDPLRRLEELAEAPPGSLSARLQAASARRAEVLASDEGRRRAAAGAVRPKGRALVQDRRRAPAKTVAGTRWSRFRPVIAGAAAMAAVVALLLHPTQRSEPPASPGGHPAGLESAAYADFLPSMGVGSSDGPAGLAAPETIDVPRSNLSEVDAEAAGRGAVARSPTRPAAWRPRRETPLTSLVSFGTATVERPDAVSRPAAAGLRPAAPTAPAPEATEPPLARPVAAERSTRVAAAPATEAEPRVFIHYGSGQRSDAEAVRGRLEASGYGAVALVEVGFAIDHLQVRYYSDADEDAAQAVAGLVSAQVRDFTSYSPAPPPGLIEIWMRSG